jgi:hypothetical protein
MEKEYQSKSKETTGEEHFKHAKIIIDSWPEWKQNIGFPPKSNIELIYRTKDINS